MNKTMSFRAKPNEIYYYIEFKTMSIIKEVEYGLNIDKDNFENGNYFATINEAKKALMAIKNALVGSEALETVKDILNRVDKMAEAFVVDWNNTKIKKWYIDYCPTSGKWGYNYTTRYKDYGTKYATENEEIIKSISEELNKAQEREMSNG